VPLLPYLLGATVLAATLALTAAALVAGGMAAGRPLIRSGLRQLAFGALAIAVTYLVGRLIGG
jgi:VIT1/CCC1 family predicted Fe2+/Mn2+ transporter